MVKCIICDRRPAKSEGFCTVCGDKITSTTKRKTTDTPLKFLTYQEHVVGLYPIGNGTLRARLLKRSAKGLPKGKTLDLNHYLKGFSREQVKRFKACVLQLANA